MNPDLRRPERRQNLLTGEWVLVSPQRLVRPWQGEVASPAARPALHYDPHCYLCPTNERAGGARNPPYERVFVFDNDYPALTPGPHGDTSAPDPLLVSKTEAGVCRVVCYSPDHSQTLSQMSVAQFRPVVDAWAAQFAELDARDDIGAVIMFENRGEMIGASNPHPHGQIWATSFVPGELAKEDARQRAWHEARGSALLAAYLERELAARERIVLENEGFVALVPYWAVWPFETLIVPRRPVGSIPELANAERDQLAAILTALAAGYDRVFDAPFPYSMGLHQRPKGAREGCFTFHAHFYPPLLRSATIRKFMVGFEMLGMPQRDLTPEDAAARLREAMGRR